MKAPKSDWNTAVMNVAYASMPGATKFMYATRRPCHSRPAAMYAPSPRPNASSSVIGSSAGGRNDVCQFFR